MIALGFNPRSTITTDSRVAERRHVFLCGSLFVENRLRIENKRFFECYIKMIVLVLGFMVFGAPCDDSDLGLAGLAKYGGFSHAVAP